MVVVGEDDDTEGAAWAVTAAVAVAVAAVVTAGVAEEAVSGSRVPARMAARTSPLLMSPWRADPRRPSAARWWEWSICRAAGDRRTFADDVDAAGCGGAGVEALDEGGDAGAAAGAEAAAGVAVAGDVTVVKSPRRISPAASDARNAA